MARAPIQREEIARLSQQQAETAAAFGEEFDVGRRARGRRRVARGVGRTATGAPLRPSGGGVSQIALSRASRLNPSEKSKREAFLTGARSRVAAAAQQTAGRQARADERRAERQQELDVAGLEVGGREKVAGIEAKEATDVATISGGIDLAGKVLETQAAVSVADVNKALGIEEIAGRVNIANLDNTSKELIQASITRSAAIVARINQSGTKTPQQEGAIVSITQATTGIDFISNLLLEKVATKDEKVRQQLEDTLKIFTSQLTAANAVLEAPAAQQVGPAQPTGAPAPAANTETASFFIDTDQDGKESDEEIEDATNFMNKILDAFNKLPPKERDKQANSPKVLEANAIRDALKRSAQQNLPASLR